MDPGVKRVITRGGSFIALLVLAIILPRWFIFIPLGICVIMFGNFYEGLFAGFLIDGIYAHGDVSLIARFKFTLLALVIIFLGSILRKRLLFASNFDRSF
jgi:hypothetical protein